MSGVLEPFPLEEEYKKHDDISPADIQKLRQWLHTQPHLPAEHITDLDLILAYHCCELSPEVTKQVIDLHFTLKTLTTRIFKDRIVDNKMLTIFSYYIMTQLKSVAHDGSQVFYFTIYNLNPKVFSIADVARGAMMLLDLFQYSQGSWLGISVVFDLHGVTMSHVTKLAQELQHVQQYLYFIQEAILLKIKSMNFINAPSFMDRLLALLKPLMKNEFYNLISVHKVGSSTIDKFMPIEAIPERDSLGPISEEMLAIVKANAAYFTKENKKRVMESCRPGKPKTISDIFGSVEGSFKKLDID